MGNPFQYRSPPVHNPSGFDLWSLGADGAPGGSGIDADLGNWPGGFAEDEVLQGRDAILPLISLGAAVGAGLGLPVYLFGLVCAALGRDRPSWAVRLRW